MFGIWQWRCYRFSPRGFPYESQALDCHPPSTTNRELQMQIFNALCSKPHHEYRPPPGHRRHPPHHPQPPPGQHQMSSFQASASQSTTIPSPPLGRKAYKPWKKKEIERLVGWVEDHVDLTHGKPSESTPRVAEEVFSSSLDNHITANKIRNKAWHLQTACNKAK